MSEGEWRVMETAPRDGSAVWLSGPGWCEVRKQVLAKAREHDERPVKHSGQFRG